MFPESRAREETMIVYKVSGGAEESVLLYNVVAMVNDVAYI